MLRLCDINKRLGDFCLSEINIDIPGGEYYVLLGRSGSGKTQLLELIAGLNDPDSGKIFINGEDVTEKRIQARNVGLVFQDYAIFPNMTVFGNIAYSLHARNTARNEIKSKVRAIADELNISHLLNRFTNNLSGGELQRVALARTLITSPRLLLLDEPMASIDASLKDDIKKIFRQLNKKGLTIVHVTHDYREAVSLASRVGVIHNGHIIQEGTPSTVFTRPVNRFVARYAGIRNFFRVKFSFGEGRWHARSERELVFTMNEDHYPGEGLIIIRSDAITISCHKPLDIPVNCFSGIVKDIFPIDGGMELMIDAGEVFFVDVQANEFKLLGLKELEKVWISFPPEAGVVLQGTN